MQIVVAGIGNSWASDDGVGPAIVKRLQIAYQASRKYGKSADPAMKTRFLTLPQADVSLIDRVVGCDLLILIDAVSSEAPPGTLHRELWRPDLLVSRGVERASSHGIGIREILDLAAVLGQLPEHVLLWGIEVASTKPGPTLSPAVAAVLPTIVEQLRQELETGTLDRYRFVWP